MRTLSFALLKHSVSSAKAAASTIQAGRERLEELLAKQGELQKAKLSDTPRMRDKRNTA